MPAPPAAKRSARKISAEQLLSAGAVVALDGNHERSRNTGPAGARLVSVGCDARGEWPQGQLGSLMIDVDPDDLRTGAENNRPPTSRAASLPPPMARMLPSVMGVGSTFAHCLSTGFSALVPVQKARSGLSYPQRRPVACDLPHRLSQQFIENGCSAFGACILPTGLKLGEELSDFRSSIVSGF